MTPPRFDAIEEGDDLAPWNRFLAKDEVRAYAHASASAFPRFTDDAGARKEGLPGMIAPGNMSVGLFTAMLERWSGPGSVARLGTTFRGLVLPDRTVHLRAVVTQKDERTRSVEVDLWMESDEGDRLVIGTATVKLA
jgi:acyl dehydratase